MDITVEALDVARKDDDIHDMDESMALSRIFDFDYTPTQAEEEEEEHDDNDEVEQAQGEVANDAERKEKGSVKKSKSIPQEQQEQQQTSRRKPKAASRKSTKKALAPLQEGKVQSEYDATASESEDSSEGNKNKKNQTNQKNLPKKCIKKNRQRSVLKDHIQPKQRKDGIPEDSVGTAVYEIFDYSMTAVSAATSTTEASADAACQNFTEISTKDAEVIKRQHQNRASLAARTGHLSKEARTAARRRVKQHAAQLKQLPPPPQQQQQQQQTTKPPRLARRNSFGSVRDFQYNSNDSKTGGGQERKSSETPEKSGDDSAHKRRLSRRHKSTVRNKDSDLDGGVQSKSPYRTDLRLRRSSTHTRVQPIMTTTALNGVNLDYEIVTEDRQEMNNANTKSPHRKSAIRARRLSTGKLRPSLSSDSTAVPRRTKAVRRVMPRRNSFGSVRDLDYKDKNDDYDDDDDGDDDGDDDDNQNQQQEQEEHETDVTGPSSSSARARRRPRSTRSSIRRHQSGDRFSNTKILANVMEKKAQEEAADLEHKAYTAEKLKNLSAVVRQASVDTSLHQEAVSTRLERLKMSIKEECMDPMNDTSVAADVLKSEAKKGFVKTLKKKLRRATTTIA